MKYIPVLIQLFSHSKTRRLSFSAQNTQNCNGIPFQFKDNLPSFINCFSVNFGFGWDVFAFGVNDWVQNDFIHCRIDANRNFNSI
jgi:hypothetical protein